MFSQISKGCTAPTRQTARLLTTLQQWLAIPWSSQSRAISSTADGSVGLPEGAMVVDDKFMVRPQQSSDKGTDQAMTELEKDNLSPSGFYSLLQKIGVDFFCGVPDSLLKDFSGYVSNTVPKQRHIITANEGSAIALATGYNLSTNRFPMVYMQNSGLGNAINPILSLTHKKVYRIPMLILIGWRGEPGKRDEPQHMIQGMTTPALLATAGLSFQILPDYHDGAEEVLETARQHMTTVGSPYCLVVRKHTFGAYKTERPESIKGRLNREEAIGLLVEGLADNSLFVSTTGMISRELFEYRERTGHKEASDFLTVGSMGHASTIAMGVAMHTTKPVVCLDGDGAALMHMGSMATIGQSGSANLLHVILNNSCHDSVGGQPTVAESDSFHFTRVAEACGYAQTFSVATEAELEEVLPALHSQRSGPTLLEVRVNPGHRSNLGRPTRTPIENKNNFLKHFRFT